MRILNVHNYYVLPGGEDTVFQNQTTLLRSRGHEVLEYIESNKKIKSMNRAAMGLQTIWSKSSFQKLKRFLAAKNPDIVHFHNTFPLISPAAYYACHDAGVPVVQTLHNQRLICPAASFYRDGKLCLDCLGKTPPWPGILHACYHNSHLHTAVVASMVTLHRLIGTWQTKIDIFVCSTNFYKDLFIESGLPVNKIVVIPHFVWNETDHKSSAKTGDYAVFVGRLDPEKGVQTLLKAWRYLDIPLKIRGEGRLSEMARQFVRQYNLDNVEFIDRLTEHELWDLIWNARFLIMASEGYYETFGLVIVEAFSKEVPVIASNIGVVPELVSDQQTGLLFESGNAEDLARKVTWLWNHPQEATRMGQAAREEYEKKYTPERNYQLLLDVYEEVVAKSR